MAMITLVASAVLLSAAVPSQAPSEGIRALSFLIGDWTSEEEARRPGQESIRFKLKGKNEWALGNTAIKIEETFEFPGAGTRHNLIVLTYDGQDKRYLAWWYQNGSPRPIAFAGTFAEGRLTLTSESDVARPRSRLRVTYVAHAGGEMDATLEVESEGKWEARTVAKYKKVG